MRFSRASWRRIQVRYVLASAALLLIGTGALRSNAAAPESRNTQEGSRPPQSPASPSQEPQYDKTIFRKPIPSGQLAFLNDFAGSASDVVIRDKQYSKLLHTVVPDCLFHFGHDIPLLDALETVLTSAPLPVQIRDGRYVMVASQGDPYVRGRGFMWIDIQDGIALGGFYFRPTNGEPTPTLTIFSKQVKEKSLEMNQLPPAFAEDLNQWSEPANIPPVEPRYFITGSNQKIVLEHDEDYCAPAYGTAAPPQYACEQMNADAADADMDAAYYLEQTDHAPNATARMIDGEDQIEWIQLRDNTCRVGPDPVRCHIRMTRERTHVIINRHPVPNIAHK